MCGKLVFFEPSARPELVEGLVFFEEEQKYLRWRESELNKFTENVQELMRHTSGGMIRFVTRSERLAIRAELRDWGKVCYVPRSATSGFDVFTGSGKEKKFHVLITPDDLESSFIDKKVKLPPGKKEVTLNLPVYGGVKTLSIGLDAEVEKAPAFANGRLMFYGSSITQGVGVSRPGNTYSAILGRWLDCPVYNFGFAGSAKGGKDLGEIFGDIKISVFVYDYDHNAESIAHFQSTHEPFFKAFRAKQPKTPVVMMSRPDFDDDIPYSIKRRGVIYDTYCKAKENGDENVFFVDGEKLFGAQDRDCCTVDRVHPNDLGNMRIALGLFEILKKAYRL